jgi:hypothetical protein
MMPPPMTRIVLSVFFLTSATILGKSTR